MLTACFAPAVALMNRQTYPRKFLLRSTTSTAHLFAFMTERRFVYGQSWPAGDVLMWDNRSVVHQAIGNHRLPRRRLLYRTMIKGSARF